MTVTPASFKTFFDPTFNSVDNTILQARIDEAERRTNRAAWGVKADDGVCYLVAHMLTMRASATATAALPRGPLTSETVGPLSRSFAAPTAAPWSAAWFGGSTWGQTYVELRSLIFADRVGDY